MSDNTAERADLAAKFWSRVAKSDDQSCWDWTGSISVYGYGQFQPGRGRNYRAHRLAYELLVGPISEGLVLDHLCRNRRCVNPGHLEPVTSAVNILRGVGVTAVNANKDTCGKGHPFDSFGSNGERKCTACANEKTRRWGAAKRQAILCGAPTRDGGKCARKIARGKKCRHHDTTNIALPATVLFEGDA